MSRDYLSDLDLALTIANQVDDVTMRGFGSIDLAVEIKEDNSPVTEVDRSAELLIRDIVGRERPHDGVHGEEYGASSVGERQWVIDPIDGTKNFMRGVPVWASLIAVLEDQRPVVGVVSAPALGRRWFAAAGEGAWRGRSRGDATRLAVSAHDRLQEASLSYSSLSGWEERGLLETFLGLTREVWRTRAYGDFWSYMMVAEGAVDIATEPELALWDMAALVPIVEEAGGRMTSLDGSPAPWGGDALATNGHLHDVVRAHLGS